VAANRVEKLCEDQFHRVSDRTDSQGIPAAGATGTEPAANLLLYPVRDEEACVGLIGLAPRGDAISSVPRLWKRLLRLFGRTVSRLADREEFERKLHHLNTYLTVSSMLAQPLGLHELLETALYCSMDVVSAEAASVLLLDDEKKQFRFYQAEGPAKPVLAAATFPADQGLAGSVLETQEPELVNDVQHDPRFYGKIDSESGFQTRNMIAIPLTAGDERIGVLEVLNKVDGGSFTDEERLLLLSIAEEIAFAVRNAKIFEYVVNSYCKQRQGQASCKGCKRPLGSWTPCVKYREAET